jgi:hypothetical protein
VGKGEGVEGQKCLGTAGGEADCVNVGHITPGDVFLQMRNSKTNRNANLGAIPHYKLKKIIYASQSWAIIFSKSS